MLTPVAGMEPWGLELREPQLQQFLSCLPFWWSRRSLSEVSACLQQWKGMVCDSWRWNRRELQSLVWFLVGFEVEWWPLGQQASISRINKRRFRAGLATTVIAFLIAWSQVSFWQPFCLAWAQIEGLRLLRNRQIKTGFKITALASNFWKMVYKCSR